MTAVGHLTFVVVPDDYCEWKCPLALRAFDWFSPGLQVEMTDAGSVYIDPPESTVTENWDHQLIGKMRTLGAIMPSGWRHILRNHVDDINNPLGEVVPSYDPTTWHALLRGVAPDVADYLIDGVDRERWLDEKRESPWLDREVRIAATHRDLPSPDGRIKALAFLCGEGGIGVIPEPSDLTTFVDWLAPSVTQAAEAISPQARLHRELTALAGEQHGDVDLSGTCLRSISFVINAAAVARTRNDFYGQFVDDSAGKAFGRDVVGKQIRERLEPRGVPAKFVARLLAVIKSKPLR